MTNLTHICHSREGGNLFLRLRNAAKWIPAFAGMTLVCFTMVCTNAKAQESLVWPVPDVSFPSCCEKPGWWDSVEDPARVQSYEELMKVWQDETIEKNVKFKVFYNAIEDHLGNKNGIAPHAIKLIQYTDSSYPHHTKILELGANHFFNYKMDLEGWSDKAKAGDTTAGIITSLAKLYLADGKEDRAVILLERMFTKRDSEINDHLLEQATLIAAKGLVAQDMPMDAILTLSYGIRKYKGDWEDQLKEKRSEIKSSMGSQYYLKHPRIPYYIGSTIVLFVFVTHLLRRRKEQDET